MKRWYFLTQNKWKEKELLWKMKKRSESRENLRKMIDFYFAVVYDNIAKFGIPIGKYIIVGITLIMKEVN